MLTGEARYSWEHGIRREDLHGDRVSVTMRESPLTKKSDDKKKIDARNE